MNSVTRAMIAIVIVIGIIGTTQESFGSLIGDNLTIRRFFPEIDLDLQSAQQTIVQEGDGDDRHFGSVIVDPNATNIFIDLAGISSFTTGRPNIHVGTVAFDGFGFRGISNQIQNVSAIPNGINVSILTFEAHSINLALEGDYNDASVDLQITFAPIPEPSTFLLSGLGLGVIGLLGYRKQRKAA